MSDHKRPPTRHEFPTRLFASAALLQTFFASSAMADDSPPDVFFERAAEGKPHQGKVLLAVQAHSDDVPLMAAGTVAKLIKEGYTGYLVRATNDDMGDAPDLGTAGSIRPFRIAILAHWCLVPVFDASRLPGGVSRSSSTHECPVSPFSCFFLWFGCRRRPNQRKNSRAQGGRFCRSHQRETPFGQAEGTLTELT